LLDSSESVLERTSNILALLPDVIPKAAIRNLEAMVLGEVGEVTIAARLLESLTPFGFVYVRDALEEEQWEDVRLEVSSVYRSAQDIGGFPEMVFEFR
jgi:hypothetical protein